MTAADMLADGWALYIVRVGERWRVRLARPDQFPEFGDIATWGPLYDGDFDDVIEQAAAVAAFLIEEVEEDSEAEDE